METTLNSKILINIVLYHPDKNNILNLLHILLQYNNVIILIFDNSENNNIEFKTDEKIILFKSEKNVGTAGAHYFACQIAEKENCDFILFLDQDTTLYKSFLNDMLVGFNQLQKIYPYLCAIGPSWYDSRVYKNELYNLKKTWTNGIKEKILNSLGANNTIISSGMLIFIPVLKKIGYPKKEYFIDLVDIEWCLRALSKNFQIKKINHIHIQHNLAEIKIMKSKILKYQKPIRYYYSIRNSFLLFSEKQFPFWFRFYILIKNIKEMQKIPFVPKPKESLLAALNGIKDGILLRKGALYK